MHHEKCTVWCALLAGAIFSSYFFKDEYGRNVTPARYPSMVSNLFDLTPLDYFHWGYVKSLVYTDEPASIAAFEANIGSEIDDILVEICGKK